MGWRRSWGPSGLTNGHASGRQGIKAVRPLPLLFLRWDGWNIGPDTVPNLTAVAVYAKDTGLFLPFGVGFQRMEIGLHHAGLHLFG